MERQKETPEAEFYRIEPNRETVRRTRQLYTIKYMEKIGLKWSRKTPFEGVITIFIVHDNEQWRNETVRGNPKQIIRQLIGNESVKVPIAFEITSIHDCRTKVKKIQHWMGE